MQRWPVGSTPAQSLVDDKLNLLGNKPEPQHMTSQHSQSSLFKVELMGAPGEGYKPNLCHRQGPYLVGSCSGTTGHRRCTHGHH